MFNFQSPTFIQPPTCSQIDELLFDLDLNSTKKINPDFMSRQIEADAILQEMQRGIRVIKFHYTKMSSKECTLRLSQDMRKLVWYYDDQIIPSDYIIDNRSCEISKIQSAIYGAQTITFKQWRM
jgi:hypothetical protein